MLALNQIGLAFWTVTGPRCKQVNNSTRSNIHWVPLTVATLAAVALLWALFNGEDLEKVCHLTLQNHSLSDCLFSLYDLKIIPAVSSPTDPEPGEVPESSCTPREPGRI